jgi:NAD(P)-dependent dehydrogenase (short-subunit alcohol dehydrogenase family)
MDGKTVLITGGNAGVGWATALDLAVRGATVVITARDLVKGQRAAEELTERSGRSVAWLLLDLASVASVRQAAAEMLERYPRLDVLINNAGIVLSARRSTADGFEATLGINHLGHQLLTVLLLERLRASAPSRIIVVSSDAHRFSRGLDLGDLQWEKRAYRGFGAYAASKLANVYFTRELARRLAGTEVTVNAAHPGIVATRFAQDGDTRGLLRWFYTLAAPLLRTPAQGARTSVYLASAPELAGVTGGYFVNQRPRQPSRVARDDLAARKLWEVSGELLRAAGGLG